ncbi:thermonuclease family protein [Phenylobacterium sp. 20VBR1]|uniref:Thermonuclease family protein n=1 Tax=Phenylobacterium glaciei TaxID=2803784 RepID=A0A941D4D5_9CAUL|nr:thermonuclease family protein [Phenylobacterium glaciei]MBR7619988.1 thermonuclease family protein [Phenylobacterium glaciei]
MKWTKATLLGALALFLMFQGASAGSHRRNRPEEVVGRVVGVTDGDTITLLTDDKASLKVRLVEIDAPEKGQPWGARSKRFLSSLIYSKRVRVVEAGRDRYGRTLGRIYSGDRDINAEMVRSGSAWAYRAYLTDLSFIKLEDEARRARRGLWSLPAGETIAPWDWRHPKSGGRENRPSFRFGDFRSGALVCGSKRYCKEMSSCLEARFYLRQCGIVSLDGDSDGRPCEKLC